MRSVKLNSQIIMNLNVYKFTLSLWESCGLEQIAINIEMIGSVSVGVFSVSDLVLEEVMTVP
jgi:hypothetical protein